MGVTNFDNLPQNLPVTRIREQRQLLREQKGSLQQISGSNIRFYSKQNDGEFAWNGRLTGSFTVTYVFEIKIKSKTAVVPLLDLAIEVYRSSNGADWELAPYAPNFADPNDPYISYQVTELVGSGDPGESIWSLSLNAKDGTWLAFKAMALANDEVTISIVRKS